MRIFCRVLIVPFSRIFFYGLVYGLSCRVFASDDRSKDYKEELAEVKRRLDERPFMWERSQMEERKKRIDKRFQEILEDYSVDSILKRATANDSSSS